MARPECRFTDTVAGLAAWQCGLFVALESVERLVAGINPTVLARAPAFWLGLGLQVVVAAAAVLLLRGTERLSRRIAAALTRKRRQPARPAWFVGAVALACLLSVHRTEPRGPPHACLA